MADVLGDFIAVIFMLLIVTGIFVLMALQNPLDIPADTSKAVTEQAQNNSTILNESSNHVVTNTRHDSFEGRKAVWAKRAQARLH